MPKMFRILLEVEEVALGHVMNSLHRTPGVARVDLLFDGAVPPAKGRVGRPPKEANGHASGEPRKKRFVDPNGVTGTDIIIKTLAKAKKPLRQRDFHKVFEETGRAGTSSHSIMHNLTKEGVIQNKGDGYVLTKKGRDKARYV